MWQEPNNTTAMDALADLCRDQGQLEQAKTLYNQSIALAPNENFTKYLNIALLLEGTEAVRAFSYGIQLIQAEITAVQAGEHEGDAKWLSSQLCSAYVSLADVYLTDLCFDENAETFCEQYLASAVQADPTSYEPMQKLASVRMSQQRTDEARAALEQSMAMWMKSDMATTDEPDEAPPADADDADFMDDDDSVLPPLEFRLETAKILLELNMPEKAHLIAEVCLAEDDENIELLYVAAVARNFVNDLDGAWHLLQRLELILSKTDVSPELQQMVGALVADVKQRLLTRAASAGVQFTAEQ
eukprot:TRINITY_DN3473_c0_g1_i2.p1 TRINITY_DN3473_c0_g1~~TRINITY_DN3473_c0_g1_i2.p1  ORF type:complete len:301 (+),score=86.77 TRINITY_DN3473_c0_g1_i2:212-1114(+)